MAFITRDRCRRVFREDKPLLSLSQQRPFTLTGIGNTGLTVRLDGVQGEPEVTFTYDELNRLLDDGLLEAAIDDGGSITNKIPGDTVYESYKFAIVTVLLERYSAYTLVRLSKW